jgi:hypothetical protein
LKLFRSNCPWWAVVRTPAAKQKTSALTTYKPTVPARGNVRGATRDARKRLPVETDEDVELIADPRD